MASKSIYPLIVRVFVGGGTGHYQRVVVWSRYDLPVGVLMMVEVTDATPEQCREVEAAACL